jgi:hypothetical protein
MSVAQAGEQDVGRRHTLTFRQGDQGGGAHLERVSRLRNDLPQHRDTVRPIRFSQG